METQEIASTPKGNRKTLGYDKDNLVGPFSVPNLSLNVQSNRKDARREEPPLLWKT